MSLSKVFFLSSEIDPFSKTYSLSDFSYYFGSEIKNNKEVDIRMCQPKYGYISERKYILREVIRLKDLEIEFNPNNRISNLKSAFIPRSRVQVYFMEDQDFFHPVSELLYKSKNGRIFSNNSMKFAFFSKTILTALKKLYWPPEVIVCNDWQMSFVPIIGKHLFNKDEFYKNIKYVYIMHSYDQMKTFNNETFESVGVSSKDFNLKDNHYNAVKNADFTIILNDMKNPIINKIKKNNSLNKLLLGMKKKYKVYDINYNSEDFKETINKIVDDVRSL